MANQSKKRFFDHGLQTEKKNILSVIKTNKTQSVVSEHDAFLKFRNELKSMFADISDSTIYLLHQKFKGSPNSLADAINTYLDDSKNFPDHESKVKAQVHAETIKSKLEKGRSKHLEPTPETTRTSYEYTSRKKDQDCKSSGTSLKFFKKAKKSGSSSSTLPLSKKPSTVNQPTTISQTQNNNFSEHTDYWKKYIGTLNISCWCTRSIYSLTSIYQHNRIVFSKPHDSDVVYVSHEALGSSYKRELGRLSEDLAEIIGPLIEDYSVTFECKLFFIEGNQLSTGDSFVVRADCFLTEKIFQDEDESSDGELKLEQLSVMKGTNGKIEAGSRLKSCLLKLFNRVHLRPTREENSTIKLNPGNASDYPEDDESQFQELHQNAVLDETLGKKDDVSGDQTDESKLTMNQVKDLYKSTEINTLQQSLPESIPNDFNIELRPYQMQGLSWMLQREKEYDLIGLNNTDFDNESKNMIVQQLKSLENSINPLWKEFTWSEVPEKYQEMELPPGCGDSFYLNLYTGKCSITKPFIKSSCKGGILADEMGLGKTITTLSLVMSCPEDNSYNAKENIINNYAYGTTLIVVPMALLTQWEKEFNKVTKNQKKHYCYIYYGSETLGNLNSLLCQPNAPTVVLTTYGMIQSEWSRINKNEHIKNKDKGIGLFSIKFLRIILDEGHNIRNRSTKTAKAVYDLKADRRWVLTGTPIINRLEDLFSLLHYLDLKPWCYHSLWKQCISIPFDTGKDISVALDLLKSILDPILLRRTKNQRDANGNFLVVLPPKEVLIEKLTFNKKEEAIYSWLKEKAVNSFNENFKSGMVFKNYSSILTQLLRLRQVCCHVDLIKADDQDVADDFDPAGESHKKISEQSDKTQKKLSTKADDEMLSVVEMIETNEKQQRIPVEEINKLKEEIYQQYETFDNVECSICTDMISIDTCTITECKHCFCLPCLTEHFEFQLKHSKGLMSENKDTENNFIHGVDFNKLKAEEVFCPMCREKINNNRLFRTVRRDDASVTGVANIENNALFLTQNNVSTHTGNQRNYFVRPFTPNHQSSKINALLIHLEQIKQQSPGEHVIVFSQFTSFLDLIGDELEKYTGEFDVLKFDGRLNLEQRQKVLNQFEKDIPKNENKISVLLLSLKAGGVGLNLTVASRAFLMDPHWNNAIEFQAIDRLHRVGQQKEVKVIRFIMENSIEERMLLIQNKKNQLGEALSMTDEERKKKRMEELQSLFQE